MEEKEIRDLDRTRCLKDGDDKILVHEKYIKDRWKIYLMKDMISR